MKILITGAEGLLGSNLSIMYSNEHEVYATGRNKPDIPNCMNYKLDITEKKDLNLIIDEKPDLIVHCAALVNVDYCEDHPDEAEKLNYLGTKNIAEASKEAGCYLVHISTDAVFDGKKGYYSEKDQTHPLNVYGKTKLKAEQIVQHIDGKYVIIRTNIYGWNRKNKESLAEWMICKLENNELLHAIKDIYFSPILVNNLGDAILELYNLKFNGILNVAGTEICSKLEFAKKIAEIFNLNQHLIEPINSDKLKFKAKRAKNMGLNTKKAQSILKMTKLLNVKDGLQKFKKLQTEGYLNELKKKNGE